MDHFHKCMLLVADGMLWFQHLKQHISEGFQQVAGCSLWWLLVCQCCPPAGSSPVCPPTNPGLSEGKAGEGTTGGKTHFQLFPPEDSLSWIVYKIVNSHLVLLGSSERVVPCKMCPVAGGWPDQLTRASLTKFGMVSCATVKSPLGLLKCILIVSHFMQMLQDEPPNYWTLAPLWTQNPNPWIVQNQPFPLSSSWTPAGQI